MPNINMPARTVEPASFDAEQRLAVINYCRLDFDGARLSAQSFDRMRSLLMQAQNAPFESFEVVSRYSVPAPADPSGPVIANYRLIGRWDNRSGWKEGNFIEDVRFDVVQREGAALISNIEPGQPHVSARAALAYLRQRLSLAKTDAEHSMIQKAIDSISATMASTNPVQSSTPAAKP
ncbi:MAG TPA: hypothetical protein VMU24_11175 [Candidatus Acidoferrales bacterium]|nr:hypothetical protein [Candidatus Acidoferrales bacterium]